MAGTLKNIRWLKALFVFLALFPSTCLDFDEYSGSPASQAVPVQENSPAGETAAGSSPESPRSGLAGNWHDAQPGDWVQFVNLEGGVVTYTVTRVDEAGVEIEVSTASSDGEPPSKDSRRIDTSEYFKPRKIDRFSPVDVRFELPADCRMLECDRHVVTVKGRGEVSETVMCSKVRAGGIVFIRQGTTTYYVLLDFGDKGKKPRAKWDAQVVKELRDRYDQPFTDVSSLQEDPPEGEPPEPPED